MATKTLKVDLPAEIFDVETNIPLIHQVVVAQQAAARQGTHSTKTRGEVAATGKKPFKQKGTGRARQGGNASPILRGGGVAFGPRPRDYSKKVNRTTRRLAFSKVLTERIAGHPTDRARGGRIHVVDSLIAGDAPSTKSALAALAGLTERTRVLVVLERDDVLTWLSLRNASAVHILAVDQLNTYDVLLSDDIVFTKGAYDTFVSGAQAAAPKFNKVVEAKGEDKPAKKAAKADETHVGSEEPVAFVGTDDVEADEFAGSAKPLADGEAPAGYDVKGNKDSMKYHEPGGRWYDCRRGLVQDRCRRRGRWLRQGWRPCEEG